MAVNLGEIRRGLRARGMSNRAIKRTPISTLKKLAFQHVIKPVVEVTMEGVTKAIESAKTNSQVKYTRIEDGKYNVYVGVAHIGVIEKIKPKLWQLKLNETGTVGLDGGPYSEIAMIEASSRKAAVAFYRETYLGEIHE